MQRDVINALRGGACRNRDDYRMRTTLTLIIDIAGKRPRASRYFWRKSCLDLKMRGMSWLVFGSRQCRQRIGTTNRWRKFAPGKLIDPVAVNGTTTSARSTWGEDANSRIKHRTGTARVKNQYVERATWQNQTRAPGKTLQIMVRPHSGVLLRQ